MGGRGDAERREKTETEQSVMEARDQARAVGRTEVGTTEGARSSSCQQVQLFCLTFGCAFGEMHESVLELISSSRQTEPRYRVGQVRR